MAVPGSLEGVAREQLPSHPRGVVTVMRQIARPAGEPGGGSASASSRGMLRRRFERSGDARVRFGRRLPEVSRPLLEVIHDVGQPAVHGPPGGRRRPVFDRSREQRVSEAQSLAVALQDLSHERLLEAPPPGRCLSRRPFDQRGRGQRERRRRAKNLPSDRRQRRDARAEQPLHVRRNGKAASLVGADDLKGRKRIAARGRLELRERPRRQAPTGTRLDQRAEFLSFKRADGQLKRRILGQAPDERRHVLVGNAAAHGRQETDTARRPPQGERQDRRTRRVEPLPVVDRHNHGAELAKQRQHAEGDGAHLRRRGSGFDQQGGVQRAPQQLRNTGDPVHDRLQQVAQSGERTRRLGSGRPRDKHRGARLAPAVERRGPQRGLSDARLADKKRQQPSALAPDECVQQSLLLLAADDHDASAHDPIGSRTVTGASLGPRRAPRVPAAVPRPTAPDE